MIDQSATACAPPGAAVLAAELVPLDGARFTLLYEQHLPGVYRYVSSRVGSREEAEDVTAEAFRAAWSSRASYRGRGSFRAWLFGIVRRTLADHYRRRRTRPAAPLEGETADLLPDSAPSPEEQALEQEQQQRTRGLLAGLNPQQQEVLSLRFAADLTYPEIAVVIGKREEAVKKIAQRALETLRGRHMHAQPS